MEGFTPIERKLLELDELKDVLQYLEERMQGYVSTGDQLAKNESPAAASCIEKTLHAYFIRRRYIAHLKELLEKEI